MIVVGQAAAESSYRLETTAVGPGAALNIIELFFRSHAVEHWILIFSEGSEMNCLKLRNDITGPVRESYDRLAAAYAAHYAKELLHKPFDRELLTRFAAEVRDSGEVYDMGCGPGQIARYLRDAGLAKVSGLDLSPCMVEQARRLNPDITFQVGDMLALPLPDSSLAGIVAFYAIVNIPREMLPTALREMWRVLQPGGRLVLSFHIGDDTIHPGEFLGQRISIDFFFFQPAAIRKHIEDAGLIVEEIVEREPYSPDVEYQSRRAYICALKPQEHDMGGIGGNQK